MQNVGGGQYNFQNFKQAYDTNPAVKNIVKTFNRDGIELKTNVTDSNPDITDKKKKSDIRGMAKRATSKRM